MYGDWAPHLEIHDPLIVPVARAGDFEPRAQRAAILSAQGAEFDAATIDHRQDQGLAVGGAIMGQDAVAHLVCARVAQGLLGDVEQAGGIEDGRESPAAGARLAGYVIGATKRRVAIEQAVIGIEQRDRFGQSGESLAQPIRGCASAGQEREERLEPGHHVPSMSLIRLRQPWRV